MVPWGMFNVGSVPDLHTLVALSNRIIACTGCYEVCLARVLGPNVGICTKATYPSYWMHATGDATGCMKIFKMDAMDCANAPV